MRREQVLEPLPHKEVLLDRTVSHLCCGPKMAANAPLTCPTAFGWPQIPQKPISVQILLAGQELVPLWASSIDPLTSVTSGENLVPTVPPLKPVGRKTIRPNGPPLPAPPCGGHCHFCACNVVYGLPLVCNTHHLPSTMLPFASVEHVSINLCLGILPPLAGLCNNMRGNNRKRISSIAHRGCST